MENSNRLLEPFLIAFFFLVGAYSIYGLFFPVNSLLFAITIFIGAVICIIFSLAGVEETYCDLPECPHCKRKMF